MFARFLRMILMAGMVSGLVTIQALAETQQTSEGEIQRIGGDYEVTSIDKLGERSFRVVFKSIESTGKFDKLVLESDHLHVAVKVGQKLRLSAEILAVDKAEAEVAQVVLFLPNIRGHVPVWLLSNKAPMRDLRGSKYLEMHVPLNDYFIM